MADFGNLNQLVDSRDFYFVLDDGDGEKTWEIKPTVMEVLTFMSRHDALKNENVPIDGFKIWELALPLFGAELKREPFKFVPIKNHRYSHIIGLFTKHLDVPAIDRILTGAYLKYTSGDEVATEFMKTGDLGKALKAVRVKKEAEYTGEKETQKGTGETTATA